jgi:hypothetical protein
MRTRPPRPIDQADLNRIIAALERLPEKEGLVGHRTRAFVYLLLDGALRTGAALWLDIEEVVKDRSASRIHVVQEPLMRPLRGQSGPGATLRHERPGARCNRRLPQGGA